MGHLWFFLLYPIPNILSVTSRFYAQILLDSFSISTDISHLNYSSSFLSLVHSLLSFSMCPQGNFIKCKLIQITIYAYTCTHTLPFSSLHTLLHTNYIFPVPRPCHVFFCVYCSILSHFAFLLLLLGSFPVVSQSWILLDIELPYCNCLSAHFYYMQKGKDSPIVWFNVYM